MPWAYCEIPGDLEVGKTIVLWISGGRLSLDQLVGEGINPEAFPLQTIAYTKLVTSLGNLGFPRRAFPSYSLLYTPAMLTTDVYREGYTQHITIVNSSKLSVVSRHLIRQQKCNIHSVLHHKFELINYHVGRWRHKLALCNHRTNYVNDEVYYEHGSPIVGLVFRICMKLFLNLSIPSRTQHNNKSYITTRHFQNFCPISDSFIHTGCPKSLETSL